MKKYILAAVIILLIFVRLWKVPELFNFTFGEEMQAFMAWEQVKDFHLIWIGVSAANINYYLGPGFTYLNAFLFFLTPDPAILAYTSAVLSLMTIGSLYYVVRKIISDRVAFLSVCIYGFSTLINLHDRRFWNPTPLPFLTIWMIFSLVKAQKDTRWFILTAAVFGLAFHIHLTLLLFGIPAAYVLIKNIKKVSWKTWIGMIGAYLVITSPLIVYDINHNYDNLLMPYRTLVGEQKSDLYSFSLSGTVTHVQDLFSTFGRLWFIKLHTNPHDEVVLEAHLDKTEGNMFLSALTFGALVWFILKYRGKGAGIFALSIAAIIAAFILYPSYNLEYYLLSLFVLLSIAIGWVLSKSPVRATGIILTLFIAANVVSTATLSDRYGLLIRKELVRETMQTIGDKSFELKTHGPLPNPQYTYAGWRYLFKAYGKTPDKSNVDVVLGWIYQNEIIDGKPELLVIVSEEVPPSRTEKPIAVYEKGPYRAYIYKNTE